MGRLRAPGLAWPLLPVAAGLLFVAAALALAGAGGAERDAPAIGGDGVWHAGPRWAVEAAEQLSYEGVTIEAPGNLTLDPGATLALSNVTLLFDGGAEGLRAYVGLGSTLRMTNTTVTATAPGFVVEIQSGTLVCAGGALRLEGSGGAAAGFAVSDGELHTDRCDFAADATAAMRTDRSTLELRNSTILTLGGVPAPLGIFGRGEAVLDNTSFGALSAGSGASVTLYSRVTFQLADPSGGAAPGRVNGTLQGPRYFYSLTDGAGSTEPLPLLWMRLDPAPEQQLPSERNSAPVAVTATAAGVGGNTTSFVISEPHTTIALLLEAPFDVGIGPPQVQAAQPTKSGPRAFFVDLGSTHSVTVRFRNGDGLATPPLVVQVTQIQADPLSWAPHALSREVSSLAVPALDPGTAVTLSFDHAFEAWGTPVVSEGPCYRTEQYFSLFHFAIEVEPGQDFTPWNDTAVVGVITFRVEGDPQTGCASDPGLGAGIVGTAAAVAVGGAVFMGYFFSGARVARRAARRSARESARPPEKPQ